jgi:hypothetical protein
MNSFERIEAAVQLKPVDRLPVSPIIIGFAAACAGMTQGEIYSDIHKWMKALTVTYEKIGKCDSVFPRWPYDVARMQMLECRIPGENEDEAVQMIEKELMKRDDYAIILSGQYTQWFFNHIAKLWGIHAGFPFSIPRIIPGFLRLNMRTGRIVKYWEKRKVPPAFHSACYPPFDMFSLLRSMEEFFFDLYDCPEIVEKASAAALEGIIQFAQMPLKLSQTGANKKICIYPMRSSATFISPATFERFSLPYLKKMVDAFWKKGIVSVLHCDGNWAPMLKCFKTFPKKSCIVELDEQTDIFFAKHILGDHLCLKGNVPASLLAFGQKEDVLSYCQKLNAEIGKGGGFILSTGCEAPLNAKVENVKAIVESVYI